MTTQAMKKTIPAAGSASRIPFQAGFSLIELSVVLIVIALIASALTVGADLQRNSSYQRLSSSFVRGWELSYLSYRTKYGVVVGDSQTAPTGFVKGNITGAESNEVCDEALRGFMLTAGVEMPGGRAEGKNTRYVYQDSNGNPQELQLCFRSIPWALETAAAGTYANQVRNVMVIKQVTPDLARLIDSLVDTSRDAQFGKVRQFPSMPASGQPVSAAYSINNTCVQGALGTNCGTALDEAQVQTLTLYYLMD
jgi:prepilin-type N-terminal cleavage/methylation domain-containing protein